MDPLLQKRSSVERKALLQKVLSLSDDFLASLGERHVGARASRAELFSMLGGLLPEEGLAPEEVIEELARGAERGLVASAGPRYFGFVIGGSLPAALAADWLTSVWDQNAASFTTSPAAAVIEEIVSRWLLTLFGLPPGASVGFVTGAQMANTTCLAAARHAQLARFGWDVEEQGLQGAPPVQVFLGEEAHITVVSALRFLGLGSGRAQRLETDKQGRIRPEALQRALASCEGPALVCAQAGEVNTGSFDLFEELASLTRACGAWLHIDGAFGLWATTNPSFNHLTRGIALADSWAVDAHKWLNTPYDCGLAIVADSESHRACMAVSASYLVKGTQNERDPRDFTPELSRRGRGFALYAALRSLGRRGVADLIERSCRLAARMATRLAAVPGIQILNEIVLNQVLVRFMPPSGDADVFTQKVICRIQEEGVCWLGGTRWRGMEAMRISVSNWSTTEDDIDRAADSILAAAQYVSKEDI